VPLILSSDGRQMKIDVILGGMPLRMIVDTGATSSTITASFASMLLRNGNAVEIGEVTARYANGSTGKERVLRVKEMRIGSHVLRDVLVSVSEGMTLLGFDAMNAIGPFTIDARAGEIIWHVKRG
jgi:predicted aspartyl protease